MAAVAPQPVVVASPAGNPTAGCPIFLAANSEVVSSTPCLDWLPAPAGPGGAARVQLNTFQAVKAFLPRCKISRTPADLAAANAVNVLEIRLADAGWSRILTELKAAQVFTRTAHSIDELHGFIKDATIPTPANLDVVAGDWRNAEAFAVPGGAGAAAAAARAVLRPLRFLSLLAVPAVEEPAAPLPLGLLSAIVGALGPCLTQAARRVETSTVQLTAATLRLHLAAIAPTDALLAVKVAPFFKAKQLPYQLRGVGVTETELREELEDGIEYKRSDQGRLAIEEKRIHLLASGRPSLDRFVLSKSRDNLTALSCVRRLRVELLEPEKKDLDLVEILDGPDGFERRLTDRRNILAEAEAKPNSTAETITSALLDELRKLRSSGRDAPPTSSSDGAPAQLDESRLVAVLTGSDSAAFRSITTSLSTLDLSTPAGQRDALTFGFNGKCVAAVRVLFSTSENGDLTLVRRHSTLSQLNELRQYRAAYFNWHLRVGKDMVVPDRMERYTIASLLEGGDRSVLEGWLKLELDTTDFIKAPHGVMGRLQHLDGRSAPVVHDPADYFCQPALITKLCEFLHILACASGLASTSTDGYTFVTLGEWYNSHLERAFRCPDINAVRVWLERSVRGFQAALVAIKMRLRAILYSPAFERTFDTFVLPFDAECFGELRSAEVTQESLADRLAEWEQYHGSTSSGPALQSMTLPLLSSFVKTPGKLKGGPPTKKQKITPGGPLPGGPPTGGLPPGSMLSTFKYINNNKWLVTSGRVWFLDAIASHLGVSVKGPCWPFLLSFCKDENRPSRCPSWGQTHHESATSAAHALVLKPNKVFDLHELASNSQFSRLATAKEKADLAPNRFNAQPQQQLQQQQSRGRGRGRGRGRDGRGRGRDGRGRGRGGRGGQSVDQLTNDFIVDDTEEETDQDQELFHSPPRG